VDADAVAGAEVVGRCWLERSLRSSQ